MNMHNDEKIVKMFEGTEVSRNSNNGFILISGNCKTLGAITRMNKLMFNILGYDYEDIEN